MMLLGFCFSFMYFFDIMSNRYRISEVEIFPISFASSNFFLNSCSRHAYEFMISQLDLIKYSVVFIKERNFDIYYENNFDRYIYESKHISLTLFGSFFKINIMSLCYRIIEYLYTKVFGM